MPSAGAQLEQAREKLHNLNSSLLLLTAGLLLNCFFLIKEISKAQEGNTLILPIGVIGCSAVCVVGAIIQIARMRISQKNIVTGLETEAEEERPRS